MKNFYLCNSIKNISVGTVGRAMATVKDVEYNIRYSYEEEDIHSLRVKCDCEEVLQHLLATSKVKQIDINLDDELNISLYYNGRKFTAVFSNRKVLAANTRVDRIKAASHSISHPKALELIKVLLTNTYLEGTVYTAIDDYLPLAV